ncbi:MAG: anthranilate synthase component I family protein [Verrucomicrobiota bacterium]|nr:anthranilate synthase component I family protein [Verrucomicrobiota bacterium]
MSTLLEQVRLSVPPEVLAASLTSAPGVVLLRSGLFDVPHSRYSFLVANPFLRFRSFGSRCEVQGESTQTLFGNPWHLLDALIARFEILDEPDLPFPMGGCFGYWGYDLKNFIEARLPRKAVNDLELPDSSVGFYSSVLVIDHRMGWGTIISTGMEADGSRNQKKAIAELEFWRNLCGASGTCEVGEGESEGEGKIESNLTQRQFTEMVRKAQHYIQQGHIYQVNLAQRFHSALGSSSWALFHAFLECSPAPFAAWLDWGDHQIISSSPELFLHLSGRQIITRPIKGTRPRDPDANRDAQLTYELQTSPKEMAELVMITDLLRNDLGRVCEYGTVQVPDLVRLEKYPQVQHLVSTISGTLREGVTHFAAIQSCFPGGSITGAPKIRAMEIIDELETISRGPYTGSLGYIGFNRESQLSIGIRITICKEGRAWYYAGAGIVADSNPEAEYEETVAKAAGFRAAINRVQRRARHRKHQA